jgi:hypothetical protein
MYRPTGGAPQQLEFTPCVRVTVVSVSTLPKVQLTPSGHEPDFDFFVSSFCCVLQAWVELVVATHDPFGGSQTDVQVWSLKQVVTHEHPGLFAVWLHDPIAAPATTTAAVRLAAQSANQRLLFFNMRSPSFP